MNSKLASSHSLLIELRSTEYYLVYQHQTEYYVEKPLHGTQECTMVECWLTFFLVVVVVVLFFDDLVVQSLSAGLFSGSLYSDWFDD